MNRQSSTLFHRGRADSAISSHIKRENSADSWLEEQSMLTDLEFKGEIDVDLTDDKYIDRLIKETQNVRKRSKA